MANDEIKYGIREGKGHGKEVPVAASQYFHRLGGGFVYLSSGAVTHAASGTGNIAGYVDCPKHVAGTDSWVSSSTAKKDKLFVMTGLKDVFEIPYWGHTASPNATLVGRNIGVFTCKANMGATESNLVTVSNQTATTRQLGRKVVKLASPLTVVDFDRVHKTVFVKIDPVHKQAI